MLRASGDFGFGEFPLSLFVFGPRILLEWFWSIKKEGKKKSAIGVCELAVFTKGSRAGGHQGRLWLLLLCQFQLEILPWPLFKRGEK